MDPLKVLVVGAGGIGCELLKVLVLSNFKNITVVDLDTIDKSNLNRQLLFKREDIGKSKAEVVAKVITGLRPEISIVGIQANVNTFKDSFFKEFRVVFNALDNLEARRYVNRMCCFLNIPLIDAGTKSTAGQVTVHIPGVSACYDCEPKSSAKQYPVCTIRSTPTKPEHCIAWSKYLYEALFGPEDASNMLSDIFLRPETTISELFAQLFSRDLPENATALEYEPCLNPSPIKETGIPNMEELVSGLTYSFEKLISREKLVFSKNDKLAVQFIASTSNLRSLNFGLPLTEIMKIEEIAGNIIPAIASTNAIVAGLQVIEAIKLINNLETYGTVWVTAEPSNNKYIIPEKISTPKENCFTCSAGKCHIKADFKKFTVKDFISDILIKTLNFTQPALMRNNSYLYESGDDIEEEFLSFYSKNYQSSLYEIGIQSEEEVTCTDNLQNFTVVIHLTHEDIEYPVVQNYEHPAPLKRIRDEEEDLPSKKE